MGQFGNPRIGPLYPLRFKPILRRYLWGGRRLESVLGKPLGPGNDYAESWEIVDRGADQSVVSAGPLAGMTLSEIIARSGPELFGQHGPAGRFPLLFKFLDAQQQLSVQVHPDDARAALLNPPDLGKTEAWVIVDAQPGSYLFAGLKRGFDRRALERELARGTCELCLHRVEPHCGDCFFLPAGAVHALGPGLVVAEIQQSSDTTYRLFDWNRLGADGQPRQLHIQQALRAIDFELGPIQRQKPSTGARPFIQQLVECDKFVLDRWDFDSAADAGGDGRFHILAVLEGEVSVGQDTANRPLGRGEVCLVPAASGPTRLTPSRQAILLDAYLPSA